MLNEKFIKINNDFDAEYNDKVSAPLFRRKFIADKEGKYTLNVCGLGYGYYYINGKAVTEDLFTAPVSKYDTLCWYNTYDVSHLIKKGENVIAVILGCGFLNETFPSNWDNNKATWRDHCKFALSLELDGERVLGTDESWLCKEDSFVIHNQLRSGEIFDARLYDENWKGLNFDDSAWKNCVVDSDFNPELKECKCEPIREFDYLEFLSCTKVEKGYLLDFGLNSSGYLSVMIDEEEGTEVSFSHSEEVFPDGELKLNGLNVLYKTVDFQVDKYICGKKPYRWSPKFTYHGFRYVLVQGLTKAPTKDQIKAVFVHQAVDVVSEFECSDEIVNKIYHAGIRATLSNMFYALNDCPTREKFGWTNDAQASMEQIAINFDCLKFYEKWIEDFKSCMKDIAGLPAIVPTHGYGYCHGPVAEGAFFEIPKRLYEYKGDKSMLINILPSFLRYYKYFVCEHNKSTSWLCDWDGYSNNQINKDFIRYYYTIKICKIILFAKELAGDKDTSYFENEIANATKDMMQFLNEDGSSNIEGQTGPAVLLHLGLGDKDKLIKQIKDSIAEQDGHIKCGMFGIQFIYDVLAENGEAEEAYKIITNPTSPSVASWIYKGGTTLWETWKDSGFTDSRNHHMYSNVLAWFFKYLLGIRTCDGFKNVNLEPKFISQLDYAKGSVKTPLGNLKANWKRGEKGIEYVVEIPDGMMATFNGRILNTGVNKILV